MSGSVSSFRSRGSSYAESVHGVIEESDTWAPRKPQVHRIDLDRRSSMSTDNGSHSGSTLPPGDEAEEEMELKTPRAIRQKLAFVDGREQALSPMTYDEIPPSSTFSSTSLNGAGFDKPNAFTSGGSMADMLQTLLSKVSNLERRQPTVMADEHSSLQKRFDEIEKDHKERTQNYVDLLTLRNGDLENLIKVRGLLAKERRMHEEMKMLRDEDLSNVLVLREQLANATWASTRPGMPGAMTSPTSGHSHSSSGAKLSMKQSDYLWQVARTAAMEQRVLELESANKDLQTQLQAAAALPSSSSLSLAMVPASSSSAAVPPPVHAVAAADNHFVSRIEAMFEDSLRHSEKVAAKVQSLRSDKESLQKEVASLEDRNAELESLVQRLQRNLRV
ncbi:hypothetical protein LTR84_011089 [Exophiala bonariae]|uniref:Uncharacterized protein n=1 Tax=Exophiala bonariae TaxID=1690606 RepID=A0AAV9NI62_9EURO|nr:hypothetical protein LTR84_011089 [Exophiala bonariae]